ncbi:hypothetical protein [Glycomyces arizonensis]|uniref:hypothetical protein n=1 Tax=Glycomyces arizonensis TaxID=256035 RepID=UPI00040FF336|nr:hypothetical protein [Glycomyces arizonensis]
MSRVIGNFPVSDLGHVESAFDHHRLILEGRSQTEVAPGDPAAGDTPGRIRTDTIDKAGSVTLRHNGKLHHIGVGRIHEGTRVLLIVEGLDIRVLDATTGELIRHLTLDPTRDYQPTGRPKGPTR